MVIYYINQLKKIIRKRVTTVPEFCISKFWYLKFYQNQALYCVSYFWFRVWSIGYISYVRPPWTYRITIGNCHRPVLWPVSRMDSWPGSLFGPLDPWFSLCLGFVTLLIQGPRIPSPTMYITSPFLSPHSLTHLFLSLIFFFSAPT